MKKLQEYYQLAKPGIIYGNLLSLVAGFLLASKHGVNVSLFFWTLIGAGLVIGCGCVLNNMMDRNIDAVMERTEKRALVLKTIPLPSAAAYAFLLGIPGFAILFLATNVLTVTLGLIGIVFYVLVYGYAKRKTIYSTIIGSTSGAMPIVAGYTAVTNRFDMEAILLFLILATWQMPHFYGISLYHLEEYTEAGLKLWPIKKGITSTVQQTYLFLALFFLASILMSILGYKGWIFAIAIVLLSGYWVWIGIRERRSSSEVWGKKMFLFSLVMLLFISVLLAAPFS